ncbi:GNAT family N-acetyltransferase [Chungangia koreensis]|uniref:GNAT family N-acetyltransferase n=1 Tax=Chungangia koreensis TaxID=752657 RepID=A0ABV8X296_9LACT
MRDLTSSGLDERVWQLLSFATWENRIETEYEKYRCESDYMLYGFIDENELVGCIGIQLTGSSSCEIRHIAVDPETRGKSIGRQMIEYVIDRHELCHIIAETDKDAVEFYRKTGFSINSLGEKYPGVERYNCEWLRNKDIT